MRWIITLILLIIGISQASACLIEYRVVDFIPSNGTYVQNVKEDFVMVKNPYNFTITDVNVTYKDLTIQIPKIAPNESVLGRYDLKPEKFRMNITYSVVGDYSGFKITFRVFNDYDQNLRVNITFPKGGWVKGCSNCTLNDEIIFNSTIPPKSSKSFAILGSGELIRLEDGKIDVSVLEKANITFSTQIPFSIEKTELDGYWYANFTTCNDLKMPVNVTVIGYVNESEPPHSMNNSKKLFEESFILNPGKCFSKNVEVKSSTPGFFLKVVPIVSTICDVFVYSTTKINNDYVQYGVIRGFTLKFSKPQVAPPERPPIGGGGGGIYITPSPLPLTTPPPTVTPIVSPPPLPKTPSEIPLVYPVIRENVISTFNIVGVTINQIRAEKFTIATVIPLAFLSLWSIIPLATMRVRVVFDSAVFTPLEAFMFSRVVVPMGVEIGKILPGDIEFDIPNMELARYLHEVYDIPLNSAKAIALALERNYPVYLSDRKSFEVALRFGVEAYLRG